MKEIRRFLGYLRGYKGQIALAVCLILCVSALMLPYPLIMKEMLDGALPRKDLHELAFLMVLFAAVFLARGGLSYMNRFVLQRVGMRITCDLRKDVYAHLQTLSLKYYENHRTGQVVSREKAEVLGAAAEWVEGFEAETWAGRVRAVLNEPARAARLRAAGLEQARKFTWAETARQTWAVYRKLA